MKLFESQYVTPEGMCYNSYVILDDKVADLDIQTICPLHGPVLEGDALSQALRLYSIWSSYSVETDGVLVAHASIHGNTAKVAHRLGEMLKEKGAGRVVVADLCREDMAEIVEDALRMNRLIVCASSYDGNVFPPMHYFLWKLGIKGYQDRTVGIVENGTWVPSAGKAMRFYPTDLRLIFSSSEIK